MSADNGRRPAYIAIARRVFECDPFWTEPRVFSRWEAWVDLIQLAQWEPRDWVAGASAVTLQRGETRPLSRSWLAGRWGWGEKAVRGYLRGLQEGGRVRAGQETTQGPTYLVVNYDTYQGRGPAKDQTGATERASEGPGDGTLEGHAGAPPRATDINTKHQPLDIDFAGFWAAYPKRKGGNPRKAAWLAYQSCRSKGVSAAVLQASVERYARFCDATGKSGTEYVKQAQFWLAPRFEGWEQDWTLPETANQDETDVYAGISFNAPGRV